MKEWIGKHWRVILVTFILAFIAGLSLGIADPIVHYFDACTKTHCQYMTLSDFLLGKW